jgi:tetratricopeptide (TPR) repeat protein
MGRICLNSHKSGWGAGVSEEAERVGSGPEGNGAGIDPTAVALALAGADREEANAFLRDQRSLIAAQLHHLSEQIKHLHLDMWEKRLGVWLRAATFFVGISVVSGMAYLIWNAANSNGLLVEPFSIPPDLAARGLSGEVVAAKLLDRVTEMQAQTNSVRAARSYSNSWDERGVKLDIPETGVSFAELDKFLRDKLGHDVHLSGEIVRTATGVVLTVRAGTNGADSAEGPETEMDSLIKRAAESVYRLTQPYRYAVYLNNHGRLTEGIAIDRDLAARGPLEDRPWAYLGIGNWSAPSVGIDEGLGLLRRGLALEPDNTSILINIVTFELVKGQLEQSLRDSRKMLEVPVNSNRSTVRAEVVPQLRDGAQANIDRLSGSYRESISRFSEVLQANLPGPLWNSGFLAESQIGAHELRAARATMEEPRTESTSTNAGSYVAFDIRSRMLIAQEEQDWAGVGNQARALDSQLSEFPGLRTFAHPFIDPILALADAQLGKVADAEARMALTPLDCNDCLIARAKLAELRGQHERADYWFGQAINNAPSIPFAEFYWGEALLARGQPDAAIEKFKLANQKGPKFADPLEGWGEALTAKNQSHLALAKFAEAEKYAPNWGRLHMKWGEALMYADKKDEAKAQFVRAAQLDLTPSEKSELVRHP